MTAPPDGSPGRDVTALAWPDIAARLGAAAVWWVATASSERGPHTVPVWGVVVDGEPFLYGDAGARRARDLRSDPRAVLHLESGTDVLIVHGELTDVGPAAAHRAACEAYAGKYTDPGERPFLPDAPEMAGVRLYRFRPRSAMTWDLEDFFGTQRRWSSGA